MPGTGLRNKGNPGNKFRANPPLDPRWGFQTRRDEVIFNVLADLAADEPDTTVDVSAQWLSHVSGIPRAQLAKSYTRLKELDYLEIKANVNYRGGFNRDEDGNLLTRFILHIPNNYPVHGTVEEEKRVDPLMGTLFDPNTLTSAPTNYH